MQVRCESCERVHEIPDDRVPLFGARLRCASCGRLFEVPPRDELTGGGRSAGSDPRVGEGGVAVLAPERAPAVEADAGEPRRDAGHGFPPGSDDDSGEAARRLAAMLITDIAYADATRLERARREGRVLAEFAPEVARAHQLYRSRVGDDLAASTPYFRDAVFTILGKG